MEVREEEEDMEGGVGGGDGGGGEEEGEEEGEEGSTSPPGLETFRTTALIEGVLRILSNAEKKTK